MIANDLPQVVTTSEAVDQCLPATRSKYSADERAERLKEVNEDLKTIERQMLYKEK